MPLARANTKNKSRSPIPSSGIQHLQSPRPFLPPSHYAAAGGIPYSRYSEHANNNTPQTPNDFLSPSLKQSLDNGSHHRTSFIPISHTMQSSESSFEFKPAEGRRPSAPNNRKSSSTSDSHSNRRSHISDLPLLEAHLIPSLRDTINRMTKPPSISAGTAILSGASETELSTRSGRSHSSSFSSASSAWTSSSINNSSSLRMPSTPFFSSTPSVMSTPKLEMSVPSEVSTPKVKPKSVLKSALRPPLSKPRKIIAPSPDPASPSMSLSLRSVRSIIGRNMPRRTSAPYTEDATSSQKPRGDEKTKVPNFDDGTISNHTGRRRSRTDPGVAPKVSGAPPRVTATPQPNASSFVSSLPRRIVTLSRAKNGVPDVWSNRMHPNQSDDSDLESKYELRNRDSRKLVVTNSEIVPSSSSESEVEARTPERRTKLPALRQPGRQKEKLEGGGWSQPRIGLGFDFDSGMKSRNNVTEAARHRRWDENDSFEGDPRLGHSGSLTNSAISSRSSSFSNGNHRLRFGSNNGASSSPVDEMDEVRQRRREALIGIVNNIESGTGLAHPGTAEEDMTGESDYCGQEGLAISGSGDVAHSGEFTREVPDLPEDLDDRSDYGSEYPDEEENQDWTRSRSEYHENMHTEDIHTSTPTLLVSFVGSRSEGNVTPGPPDESCIDRSDGSHPFLDSGDAKENRGSSYQRAKSPSRSPVMRQTVVAAMPAALKRHSVYHGDSISTPDITHENTNYSDTHHQGVRNGNRRQVYTREETMSIEAISLAQSSYDLAARERKAFGIPPSESEENYLEGRQDENDSLPRDNSDLSSLGSTIWHDECEELSMGAEALFRKLSGTNTSRKNYEARVPDVGYQGNEGYFPLDRNSGTQASRPSDFQRPRESPPCESLLDEEPCSPDGKGFPPESESTPRCWRSTLPSSTYHALLKKHSEIEMQRQELIWQIGQTEDQFVNRLLSIVQLFVLPLRVQNTRAWITGVPLEVASLLDWLEDIINLHTEILSEIQKLRSAQYPVVERIAESIRVYIPRLEVYQPYLVRLADVENVIRCLTEDEGSDFGEFVRIQEKAGQSEGWNLERLLVEPANRLAKYPDMFRQLLDLTPKSHPDYLPSFSLFYSTAKVVRVITEVKVREEEYDSIKDISGRIQGLPSSIQLARRERRLLTQGLLHPSEVQCEPTALSSYLSRDPPSNTGYSHLVMPTPAGDPSTKRTSRLMDAIRDWDIKHGSSPSSTKSYRTMTSFGSADFPVMLSSDNISLRKSDNTTDFYSQFTNASKQHTSSFPLLSTSQSNRPQTSPLQIFVFTDVILVTNPIARKRDEDRQEWRISESNGIGRILDVTICEDSRSIILDILPVDMNSLHTGIISDTVPVVTLHLVLPASSDVDSESQKWVSSFRQCAQFTLRSLSFPSNAGGYLVHGPNLDLESDTKRSVLSILASGLPLPKSPSVQIEDALSGRYENAEQQQQEREERGWWSLRFQQVLREIHRQDIP